MTRKSDLLVPLHHSRLPVSGVKEGHITFGPPSPWTPQKSASGKNAIDNSFQKIIVVRDSMNIQRDDVGIMTMGNPNFSAR